MTYPVVEGLNVLRCQQCGKYQLPPKVACRDCGGSTLEEVRIGPEGTLFTFTMIRMPPAVFRDQAPYAVLVAELAGGIKLTGRLEGEQGGLLIGMSVQLVRRDTIGYWFRRI